MAAVPIKPEYGPTLGRLLEPRWRAASRAARWAVIAAAAASLALLAAVVLTLLPATYSQGGSVPFSFHYKQLYRARADAGAFVKVQSRSGGGALKYVYEVYPLSLPAYTGGVAGELPRYASAYVAALAARSSDFELRGEGKTRLNTGEVGYQVLYTARVEGRKMYGRNVLLLPPGEGARRGVVIAMLSAPGASTQIKGPLEVASSGVLQRPLKTFTFE